MLRTAARLVGISSGRAFARAPAALGLKAPVGAITMRGAAVWTPRRPSILSRAFASTPAAKPRIVASKKASPSTPKAKKPAKKAAKTAVKKPAKKTAKKPIKKTAKTTAKKAAPKAKRATPTSKPRSSAAKPTTPLAKTRLAVRKLTTELQEIPPPPKRPLAQYSRFMVDNYKDFAARRVLPADATAADKRKNFLDTSRDIASAWKSLPASEQETYRLRFEQERAEYLVARRTWAEHLTPAQVTTWNKRARLRSRAKAVAADSASPGKVYRAGFISKAESHQPKRPGPVFVQFVKSLTPEQRSAAGMGGPQRMLGWKAMYDALSPEQLEPLRVENKKAWEQYAKDIAEWKAKQ